MSHLRPLRFVGAVLAAAFLVAACGAPDAGPSGTDPKSVPDKPSKPVVLNILDVAGNLQLTKPMIENFVKAHPDIISKVNYSKAPAPDMAGKLKSEQAAGQNQTNLVLTGTDGLAAAISQNLAVKAVPDFAGKLPPLDQIYQPAAAAMQQLSQGYGVELVYYPSGPLLEYNPATVGKAPTTADELLAWAKAHPGKFGYANPANSGPGRTFLMGLPYILGDSNPKDPVNGWTKTWAFLKQLGQYVDYYPSGTTENMRNLASGAIGLTVSTTGWDINPRALGTVPNTMKIGTLKGFHWVSDAQFALIPKGVSADVLSANLALIKWMLQPEQQAIAYDSGYFYPGPAVKGVTLSMAPRKSQDVIAKYGRPEYDALIKDNPVETSLPAAQQVQAFNLWDRQIGAGKGKK